MGRGAGGPLLVDGGRLRREQLELERRDHRLGDLVLHREDVGEIAVELVRPEMRSTCRLDQLGGDAHPRAGLAHAALEQIRGAELLPDGAQVFVLPLEGERRGAADHPQAVHLRQRVEDLLGDAVGEVFLLLVGAEVDEGEHGDGGGGPFARRTMDGAHVEVPDAPRHGGEHADAHQEKREARTAEPLSGRGALDAALVDVEDPGQADDDGKAERQRRHHIGKDGVGPAQAVHDRLDDLQHREGAETVADQRANDAPSLQLGQQGQ